MCSSTARQFFWGILDRLPTQVGHGDTRGSRSCRTVSLIRAYLDAIENGLIAGPAHEWYRSSRRGCSQGSVGRGPEPRAQSGRPIVATQIRDRQCRRTGRTSPWEPRSRSRSRSTYGGHRPVRRWWRTSRCSSKMRDGKIARHQITIVSSRGNCGGSGRRASSPVWRTLPGRAVCTIAEPMVRIVPGRSSGKGADD
jgi:hypothetical protein